MKNFLLSLLIMATVTAEAAAIEVRATKAKNGFVNICLPEPRPGVEYHNIWISYGEHTASEESPVTHCFQIDTDEVSGTISGILCTELMCMPFEEDWDTGEVPPNVLFMLQLVAVSVVLSCVALAVAVGYMAVTER